MPVEALLANNNRIDHTMLLTEKTFTMIDLDPDQETAGTAPRADEVLRTVNHRSEWRMTY